jgi:outer membrane protein OmpA-like peptidoglycan-associated protein
MKFVLSSFLLCFSLVSLQAQVKVPSTPALPNAQQLKDQASSAVSQAGDAAFKAAKDEFNKLMKDIPFAYNSSELRLNDPSYSVAGISIDAFMKNTVIPALVKVISLLPADKQVTVIGHASRDGTEEPSGAFQGNVALSKARAEAMVKYIIRNSNLKADRFKIVAAGSTRTLPGVDPADTKNCRVSIVIE